MPLGGRFPRPILRFGKGTSIYPFEGLNMGLGPYRKKKHIRIGFLYDKRIEKEVKKFIERLFNGYKKFRGFTKIFDTYIEIKTISFKNFKEARDEGVPDLINTDIIIATVPDEVLKYEDEDYYVPLKQDISLLGKPSQMIRYSTIRWKSDNPYVIFNFAINIYAKSGGIPWTLEEELTSEAVIGIDVYANFLALTLLHRPKDPTILWSYTFNPHVEIAPSLKEPILELLEKLYQINRKPIRKIIFHRDGIAHWSEIKMVREALDEAKRHGYIEEKCFYSIIEVRKRIVPRLIRVSKNKVYNPEKGVYTWLQKEAVLVSTTGFPERPIPEYSGLIKPVLINRVDTSDWDKPLLEQARDIYWLAQLHWGSAFTTPRIPITTLYSHKICRFLSQGVYPPEEYQNTLWFL